MVMGVTVIYAGLVIAANLGAELALPVLDPRRRS
jgi:ABC-type dipeptide/oligopeptide/nickel transport system permease component